MRALRLLVVVLLLGLVACDQTTKHVATSALAHGRIVTLLPGVLDLRLAHNAGVAFSLMNGWGALAIAAVQLAVLGGAALAWWRNRGAGVAFHVALALVVGGAVANLVDRIARGSVVDFLHLAHWPIFNVADVAIVSGGLLLVLRGARPVTRSSGTPAS
jgi:signal peptidase II